MEQDKYEHARQNAKGWLDELRELHAEYVRDYADADERGYFERKEQIEERAREMPLSVMVRDGWRNPYDVPRDDAKPVEFEILLSTGGPGLRVWGELTEHGEPDNAQLQMQDWGVPWREVWPCEVEEMDEARAVLLWFAGQSYFGE